MKVTDEDFIRSWNRLGSATKVSKELSMNLRSVFQRRADISKRLQIELGSWGSTKNPRKDQDRLTIDPANRNLRINLTGTVVVFSDAHYWPGAPTPAHLALLRVIKKLNPVAVIANGDVFDGARISRHDPMGWQELPSVKQELEAAQDRMTEIEKAAPNADMYWPIGNHDLRFDKYVVTHAGQLGGVTGTRLADFFSRWKMVWALHINGNTVVKHSWHQGIHATYNNTLKGGTNVVTGHLHRLQVTAWGDYNGRRYGVDTGTLACVDGEQFSYLQGTAVPWGSGFAVLTFKQDGTMLPPELCEVVNGEAYFRGQIV